jgi:hypothetical protein
VAGLNEDVLSRLTEAIDERHSRAGKLVGQPLMLLTAPRAGYGKTHLLGRVAEASAAGVTLLPLAFRLDDEIGWPAVALRGAGALARAPGKKSGWSKLRESSAGVMSVLLLKLIQDGRLPCANPQQAVRVLSADATEIFSESGSARLIGEWLRKHIHQLRKPMADAAGGLSGINQVDLERWVQCLLNHASVGDGKSTAELTTLVTEGRVSCETWLRLLALWRPVVVLVDHLDGFYRNEQAGLRIAMLLLDLAEVGGVHVVLSLNQDVWQATFGHHLPSALEDRLTASQVLLRGLTAEDAAALVRLRLREAATPADEAAKFEQFLDVRRYFLGRPLGSVSARNFLRHAAAQWLLFARSSAFESSPGSGGGPQPAPPSLLPVINEMSAAAPASAPPSAPGRAHDGSVPVFDRETGEYMRRVAEGLAEPTPALPQEQPQPPPITSSADGIASAPTLGHAATLKNTGAFEKLREMLDRLRAADTATKPAEKATPGDSVASRLSNVITAGATASGQSSREALLGRFEALRLQMGAEADTRPLDLARVTELIRLAGKRFPLVRYDEVELPGLTGRTAACWSLQGTEILFGLDNFADTRYWKVLGSYSVGRMTALAEQARATGETAPQFKVVTFKSERESEAWAALWRTEIFPTALRPHVDAMYLDTRSIAALYAMQRMIKEAETGALRAEPAQVISVLARELDFFWKRVTRPLIGVA